MHTRTKLTYLRWIGLSLLMGICLNGCIPAAFVAGAAAGGTVVYDRRDMKTMVKDENINHQVSLAMNDDPLLKNSHIVSSTFNGVVLLAGQTPKASGRDEAERLTRAVPGVKRLFNEITIESPSSFLTRSSDTWITTKLKSKLLVKEGLQSSQIKVLTENGTVYLMGIVTPEQATLAVNEARHTTGVQQVIKVFQYIKITHENIA